MSDDGGIDRERRFEREWRAWLDRPTKRSPAAAAARVSASLESPGFRRRPLWAVAVAASLFLVAATVVFRLRDGYREGGVAPGPSVAATDTLKSGEVLMWLDADTPLYMNFQPPGTEGAK
jgi:hypothetical protein